MASRYQRVTCMCPDCLRKRYDWNYGTFLCPMLRISLPWARLSPRGRTFSLLLAGGALATKVKPKKPEAFSGFSDFRPCGSGLPAAWNQKSPALARWASLVAERARFELAIPFRSIHAFQACLLSHSSISPWPEYRNEDANIQKNFGLQCSPAEFFDICGNAVEFMRNLDTLGAMRFALAAADAVVRLPHGLHGTVIADQICTFQTAELLLLPALGDGPFIHASIVMLEDTRDIDSVWTWHAIFAVRTPHYRVVRHQPGDFLEQLYLLIRQWLEVTVSLHVLDERIH